MRAYRELGPGGTNRDREAVLSSLGHQARQTEPTRGSTELHLTMPVAPGCGHSGEHWAESGQIRHRVSCDHAVLYLR